MKKEDIVAMRKTLHEAECYGVMNLSEVLWEGCAGWKNIPDKEVIEMYENTYGEDSNVVLQYQSDKSFRRLNKLNT